MADHSVHSCSTCGRPVAWFSFWGNLSLGIYKLLVGFFGGSAALVADAMHSFTDVIGSVSVLLSLKIASRPADQRHQYGYGKVEFISSAFVYTMLLFCAAAIFYGGLAVILHGEMRPPHFVTILGAAISVLYNWIAYRLALCAGTKNNSPALLADAFENRADSISSVACIGGIGAAMFIHPICDPLAAMGVGLTIAWNALSQLKQATAGLMDRGLPQEATEQIEQVAGAQEGVLDVAFVKSRQTGHRYWVDLGIRISDTSSVRKADEIVGGVRAEVLRCVDQCHEVEVFIVPNVEQGGKRNGSYPQTT
jgi:cation diffusion facilitator family transporter